MNKFIYFILLFSCPSFAKVIFVSDLNGKKDGIVAQIDAGNLKLVEGRLEFVNKGDKFVFGGNLSGKGTDSMKIRQWMMDLKRREPGNVNLIAGTSELKTITALNAIKRYENLSDPGYVAWLKNQVRTESKIEVPKNLQGQNTALRRVTYLFKTQGTPNALKNYQAELKEIDGKRFTPTEAADRFIESIKPGGEQFRFLELSQPVAVLGKNLIIRNGVNFAPGSTRNLPDVRTWAASVNASYKRDLDAVAKGKDVKISNDSSLHPLTQEASNYLRDHGITTEIVGHPPTDRPAPLLRDGLLRFRPDGTTDAITLEDNGNVTRTERTLSGRELQYSVSPRSHGVDGVNDAKGFIGKFANEYSIVGQDESGNYVLKKYYDGHQLDMKTVSPKELTQNFKIQSVVENASSYRRSLAKKLEVPVLGPQELFEGQIGEKAPLVITGSVDDKASEQSTRKALQKLADTLDPEKIVIVTDGMAKGVAQVASEVFKKKGFATIGFVKDGTDSEKINRDLKGVVLAGPGQENPLELGLNYAKDRDGSVIFVGPEGVKNIEKANQMGVNNQIFVQGTTSDRDLISATTKARPDWVRGSRKALMEELDKQIKKKNISRVGYQDLLEKSKGYKVTVLEGLTDLDYKNPEKVKDYVRALMKANGDKAMYILDGTSEGIGEAYKWIPSIAKELKYDDIKTAGIFSEKSLKSEIAKQDYIVVMNSDDKAEDRKGDLAKVELAQAASGKVVVLSGANNAAAKIQTAVEREVPITLVADPKVEPVKSKGIVTDGTEKYKEHPKSYGGLTVANTPAAVSNSVQTNLVASEGAQQVRTVSASKGDVLPPASGEASEASTKVSAPRGKATPITTEGVKGFHDASINREAPSASSEQQRASSTPSAEAPISKGAVKSEDGAVVKAETSQMGTKEAAKDPGLGDPSKIGKDTVTTSTETKTTAVTEDKGDSKKLVEPQRPLVVGDVTKTPKTIAPPVGGQTRIVVDQGKSKRPVATQVSETKLPETSAEKSRAARVAPTTVDPKCIDNVMKAFIK